jgi:AcrR family transcriptional regulator
VNRHLLNYPTISSNILTGNRTDVQHSNPISRPVARPALNKTQQASNKSPQALDKAPQAPRRSGRSLGRPPGVRAQDTRAKLIDSAATLFAGNGFEDVTLADIASAAGLTAPAIYKHFRSKDELFVATVAGMYQEIAIAFQAAAAGSGSWQQKMLQILDTATLIYSEDGAQQRLGIVAQQKAGQNPDRFKTISNAHRSVVQVFRDIAAQAVTSGELPAHSDCKVYGDLMAAVVLNGLAGAISPTHHSQADFQYLVDAFKLMFLNTNGTTENCPDNGEPKS